MSHPRVSHSQPYSLLEAKWPHPKNTYVYQTRENVIVDLIVNFACSLWKVLQGWLFPRVAETFHPPAGTDCLACSMGSFVWSLVSEWQGARWNLSARNVVGTECTNADRAWQDARSRDDNDRQTRGLPISAAAMDGALTRVGRRVSVGWGRVSFFVDVSMNSIYSIPYCINRWERPTASSSCSLPTQTGRVRRSSVQDKHEERRSGDLPIAAAPYPGRPSMAMHSDWALPAGLDDMRRRRPLRRPRTAFCQPAGLYARRCTISHHALCAFESQALLRRKGLVNQCLLRCPSIRGDLLDSASQTAQTCGPICLTIPYPHL
ncbi:hypothetical protein Q7P35_000966 [Cladosporium inversicolor]